MTDANVPADPGNSAPEAWSEPLTAEEQEEVQAVLSEHAADQEASEQGRAQADFEVVDGNVVPVNKATTSNSDEATVEEPTPVEYRSDEQVAQDAEPVEQTPEVDGDGSSSPSN